MRVWSYDFDGTLTDEIKKIQAKRVADRSDREKETLAKLQGTETKQLTSFNVKDASVYAIRFAADNSLVFTADDGFVRHLDVDGKLAAEFPAISIDRSVEHAKNEPPSLVFDAKSWGETLARKLGRSTSRTGFQW